MGFLSDMLLTGAKLLRDASVKPDNTKPKQQAPQSEPRKFIPSSEREALLAELNRSKVFTFEYVPKTGIVLTRCAKEYNVTSLTIPDVVSRIGDEAFKDCGFLRSIYIPDSVTEIGLKAFNCCRSLENVRFSARLKKIGNRAFEECAVTDIVIPEDVYDLGDRTFYNCEKLKTVRLPDKLNSFRGAVFYGCTALEEIILPMSMNGAMTYNLFSHSALRSAYIPQGIERIEDWAFEYCHSLTDVYIPDSVKKICNRAFLYCDSLEYIYIPDSVEVIESSAVFAGCRALKKIRLPIGIRFEPMKGSRQASQKDFDRIFHNCDSLETVVLGSHSFHVDEPPKEKDILGMRIELAAEGNPTARRIVLGDVSSALCLLADRGDAVLADRLLSCGILTTDTVDIEDFDKAIDYAAEKGASEVYVVLVQFKRDKLGYDVPEDRFRL